MTAIRLRRSLAGPLLLVTLLAAPAGAALPDGATLRLERPGRETTVVAGVLSAPSRLKPAEVARAFVASRPASLAGLAPEDLAVTRVAPVRGGGAVVRLDRRFQGLEVVGRSVAIRTDAEGRVRWVRGASSPLPKGLSVVPSLTPAQAVDAVLAGPAAHQGPMTLDPKRQSELVVWAPPGQTARLAYRVLVPRNYLTAETLRAYVDARTGRVLTVENLVRRAKQATVYEFNPVSTPDPKTVTLPLPDGSTSLSGPDIVVHNCIDRHNCRSLQTPYGPMSLHFCDMEPVAVADDSGDFTAYQRPADDTDPEDSFSEVQMYYHTTKAYEAFRGWGFDHLNAWPLTAVVNMRIPSMNDMSGFCMGPTNDGELFPFDNAAFMPAGTLYGFPEEDEIVFGQGTVADFSYDGDVVYHEFTHAVMFTLTSLGMVVPDSYGLDTTPGALHEGYADYFSSAITGDPETGEYAGQGLVPDPLPSGAIRTLTNQKTCPADLTGESHEDSQPWAGGLWDVRQALVAEGSSEAEVDAAIFAVLSSLGEMSSVFDAESATVAEIETRLGSTAAGIARGLLEGRGLDGCNDRVIPTDWDATKGMLMLYGNDQVNVSTVPGPVQFAVELPVDATAISVSVGQAMSMGGGAAQARLLLKADEPIHWNWTASGATDDSERSTGVSFNTSTGAGAGTLTADLPAGTYHLQLVNPGGSIILQDVSFSYTPAEGTTEPDGGVDAGTNPGTEDGGTDPQADGGVGGGGGGAETSGCGCSATSSGAGALPFALLLGVLALTRRRR